MPINTRPILLKMAYGIIFFLVIIGIFGPLFSSTAPWSMMDENGNKSFPAWTLFLDHLNLGEAPITWKNKDWTIVDNKQDNWIPFDPDYIDLSAVGGIPPSSSRKHYLGTDLLGRDVLSGLIEGTFVSISVGLLATFIALILSFLINMGTSFVGNDKLHLNLLQISLLFLVNCLVLYYLFIGFGTRNLWGILCRLILLCALNWLWIKVVRMYFDWERFKKYKLPMDDIGMKIYEIMKSIPTLLFLLVIIGLAPQKNILFLSMILGVLMWPILFRYIRMEILQEQSKDSYLSLQNMGISTSRIIFFHLIPSMIPILITPVIFIFIGAIVSEASLSFLGIGLDDNTISWGTLLAQARQRISAWWLVVFPGMLLFLMLFSLNIIARYRK